MDIRFTCYPDHDEVDGKSLTEQSFNVEISGRVSETPSREELNCLYEKFAAAIGAVTKGKTLGGSA